MWKILKAVASLEKCLCQLLRGAWVELFEVAADGFKMTDRCG
jgi:hypothetical protein